VLILPGGGYCMCSDREAEPVALPFLAAGCTAAVLRYSVAPTRHPAQLHEAAAAMAYLREHADEYHIDPARVFVCGFSAGGHLAAMLGCLWHETPQGEPACQSPSISHAKMECAFIEYIQNISDITEESDISPKETTRKTEQELLASIVDYEKKLSKLHARKKQVMEQYMQGALEFDEYKSMIRVFNEQCEALDSELQRKRGELASLAEIPEVLPEDIIANLNQNWGKLNNSERRIFLERFVKSITITVEKENRTRSNVKIDSIEFHSGELQTMEMVRSKLGRMKSSGGRAPQRQSDRIFR
jgi:esterase/lipase